MQAREPPSPLASPAPTKPHILSLPEEVLLRLFALLGAPLHADAGAASHRGFPSAVIGATHTHRHGSPAAALALTCRPLYDLHRRRAVRCVDLRDGPCGATLPKYLALYPEATAAVIDGWKTGHAPRVALAPEEGPAVPRHAGKEFGARNVALTPGSLDCPLRDLEPSVLLARLRKLCVMCRHIPSKAAVALLFASVPRLYELGLCGGHEEVAGSAAALMAPLPLSLRRLSIKWHASRQQIRFGREGVDVSSTAKIARALDEFWNSVGSLRELVVLNIDVFRFSRNALAALRSCQKLQELRVQRIGSYSGAVLSLSDLVAVLPPSLRHLNVRGDTFSCRLPYYTFAGHRGDGDSYFEHLGELEYFEAHGFDFHGLKLLHPLSSRLRELRLRTCDMGSSWTLGSHLHAFFPEMPRLVVFHAIDDNRSLGMTDALLANVLAGCRNLREVCVTYRLGQLTNRGIAAAARHGACGKSLRALHVRRCYPTRGAMSPGTDAVSDPAAVAISIYFPFLNDLDLAGSCITHLGVTAIEEGCKGLEKFGFEGCSYIPNYVWSPAAAKKRRRELV